MVTHGTFRYSWYEALGTPHYASVLHARRLELRDYDISNDDGLRKEWLALIAELDSLERLQSADPSGAGQRLPESSGTWAPVSSGSTWAPPVNPHAAARHDNAFVHGGVAAAGSMPASGAGAGPNGWAHEAATPVTAGQHQGLQWETDYLSPSPHASLFPAQLGLAMPLDTTVVDATASETAMQNQQAAERAYAEAEAALQLKSEELAARPRFSNPTENVVQGLQTGQSLAGHAAAPTGSAGVSGLLAEVGDALSEAHAEDSSPGTPYLHLPRTHPPSLTHDVRTRMHVRAHGIAA